MGGGESKILNANPKLVKAGIIDNSNQCNHVLCSPNIANFTNYKNNNNINNIIKIYLIFLMFIYIFIWIIIINKMI